jgi:ComF family protein
MLQALFTEFFDLLVPPRATERVVRTLSLNELNGLALRSLGEEGLPYHDPRVTALIWELKYYANRRAAALAGTYLSEVLLAAAAEELGTPMLVPVPMHAARRRERGHNQTELLCRATMFALRSSQNEVGPSIFEYAPKVLKRTVDTKTQQGLPRAVRLQNVKNSMLVENPDRVAGRVCIVVDDVTTTGATLAEAKRALKAAGARAVHTIALARS